MPGQKIGIGFFTRWGEAAHFAKVVDVPDTERVSLTEKYSVKGRGIRIARLEEEWYEDIADPNAALEELRKDPRRPDVFSFWQRLPDAEPRFPYARVQDSIAALPITTFPDWWEKQIDAKTRNMARKASKKGVDIRCADFDDAFVQGITSIFNETPVRQGKPFWHYGKDAETIKREFSRFLFREEIIGAYLGEELVGFIMLAYAGKYAITGQIISKIAHRDKAPTNALLAKAVEICAAKGIPYLVYAKWVEGSLGEFKRSNGFVKIDLPRYFVPLTLKGRLYVAGRLYMGKDLLPESVVNIMKSFRRRVAERRAVRVGPVAST